MRLHRANQRKVSHSRGSCGPKAASRATISSRRLQNGVARHEGGRPEYPRTYTGRALAERRTSGIHPSRSRSCATPHKERPSSWIETVDVLYCVPLESAAIVILGTAVQLVMRDAERDVHLSEMSELEDVDGVSGLRQSYC